MVEFDVETRGLQWYDPEQRMFLFQALVEGEVVVLRHPEDREAIQAVLDRDDDFRAWNAKFDLAHLEAAGYTLPPASRWHDGMVFAHLMDERRSVALKAKAEQIFGPDERDLEKEVKAWLKEETTRRRKAAKESGTELKRPTFADVPSKLMAAYGAQDVVLQQKVCASLELAAPEQLLELYEMERGVLQALYAAERRGLPVDRAAAVRLESALLEEIEQREARCIELAGIKTFNPRSSAQIIEALERRGADTSFMGKTKTGRSADTESLQTVNDELASEILEYRNVDKMLGTYIRPLLHTSDSSMGERAPFITSDNFIHPNFRQVGARTGRMSASDPNIQNWHRDDLRLRNLIAAEPGHKLVAVDLDAIEMRLFAAYCGDGPLLEAVKDGDIHQLTADRVGITDRERAGGHVESARQRAKILNFSVIYGAGVRSLRKQFGITQDEARLMLDRYHASYPEVGALQDQIAYTLADQGYVKSKWGRRYRVDRDAYREAYKFTNYIVQGTAADLLKASLVRIHEAGVPVIACVHDEVIAHVPEVEAEDAAAIIVDALTDHERITQHVPLSAEAAIVDRWSQVKDPAYGSDNPTHMDAFRPQGSDK